MYPVAVETDMLFEAPIRSIKGYVAIDYTGADLDQSIQIIVNEAANTSYPLQVADGLSDPSHKYACLDPYWELDGTYKLAPSSSETNLKQMGWWGSTLSEVDGLFPGPVYPTITITHISRPMHELILTGDSIREEYPVDFTYKLYDDADHLLHTETVVGNTEVYWRETFVAPIPAVAKQVVEITRWSRPFTQVKIVEMFTSIQQEYDSSQLVEISLIEERETQTGSLPLGVISANELQVVLKNDDRLFDPENEASPIYQLLKPNRRMRAWLAAAYPGYVPYIFYHIDQLVDLDFDHDVDYDFELDDANTLGIFWCYLFQVEAVGEAERVPLGHFWTTEWDVATDRVDISVVGRDRLELLKQSTFTTTTVLENQTLLDLAELVLLDADLDPSEFQLDEKLDEYLIRWAWFPPMSHREALRLLAEACAGMVYTDREGVVRVVVARDAGVYETAVSVSEEASVSYRNQVVDGITTAGAKYLSLDEVWELDGTYSLPPGTEEEARLWQMGWWSEQISGVGGTFTPPLPELIVTFPSRIINTLSVSGDSAREEFPVDFTIELFDKDNNLLHTETVIGNTDIHWSDVITPVAKVTKQVLTIETWNQAGVHAKIVEFFTLPLKVIGPELYYSVNNPLYYGSIANEVAVLSTPLAPTAVAEEVYRSHEVITVPAGTTIIITVEFSKVPVIEGIASLEGATDTSITVEEQYGWGTYVELENVGAADEDITLVVEGKPLEAKGQERVIVRDEDLITELGILHFELSNPLIQRRRDAQDLAETILSTMVSSRRDVEIDWRGNPVLELGDLVETKGGTFVVIRNSLNWAGLLHAQTSGRRA